MRARYPSKDRAALPKVDRVPVWGPWVKTSKELGLSGAQNKKDKKDYNEFIKEYMNKLSPTILNARGKERSKRKKLVRS